MALISDATNTDTEGNYKCLVCNELTDGFTKCKVFKFSVILVIFFLS